MKIHARNDFHIFLPSDPDLLTSLLVRWIMTPVNVKFLRLFGLVDWRHGTDR